MYAPPSQDNNERIPDGARPFQGLSTPPRSSTNPVEQHPTLQRPALYGPYGTHTPEPNVGIMGGVFTDHTSPEIYQAPRRNHYASSVGIRGGEFSGYSQPRVYQGYEIDDIHRRGVRVEGDPATQHDDCMYSTT
ncbi:hypothetical protein B0H34DRAFT_680400 [Crassisporium funariophilum]|nr:hypothetical protein B0H34DRAFT_680400 [Crassisporium funariophilum]